MIKEIERRIREHRKEKEANAGILALILISLFIVLILFWPEIIGLL